MEVWEAIRSKRAVRKFTDQPLANNAVERILDAGRRSQSSKNVQPWHFIAIRDRDTLQKLSKQGDFLGHVAGSTLCVVIAASTPYDLPKVMFDIGQCASYMQLAALEVGVGSCLGTIYDAEGTRALLGIPDDVQVQMLISFGYPAFDPDRKGAGKAGRKPLNDVVHWDKW